MKAFTTAGIATATLLASVSAQEQYTIDPDSVSNATRTSWCYSQVAECPLICVQTTGNTLVTEANSCDPTTLTYSCICSNGLSPNVTEYSQTLPYYICSQWGDQCVANCGGDNICASDCRSEHPCGAQNPVRQNTSTLSKTMSKTGSSSLPLGATTSGGQTVYTGFAGVTASSTGSSGDASASASAGGAASIRVAALNAGQTFGLLAVAGALFGGFAILL
ncbi:hypothetical protein LTR36_003278 [Oleoguttula mirabilis]|uniref:DUF7707 domain-containing protein n=1 Tax=Oleoguttula mirabilis TaxID=1507867 RepID=A0AAV9JYU5_9PEZI|nr:hypothetical protein LTR36_003278 [Oleoguttula mirabilis]